MSSHDSSHDHRHDHRHGQGPDAGGPPFGASPDCEAALAEVYTYLDHELTVVEHERVLTHLESCGPCYEAFDFEAEFRMVVASKALSDEFPEGLRLRIMRRIEEVRIERTGGDPGAADSGIAGRGA